MGLVANTGAVYGQHVRDYELYSSFSALTYLLCGHSDKDRNLVGSRKGGVTRHSLRDWYDLKREFFEARTFGDAVHGLSSNKGIVKFD